jgi:hypothetical protein
MPKTTKFLQSTLCDFYKTGGPGVINCVSWITLRVCAAGVRVAGRGQGAGWASRPNTTATHSENPPRPSPGTTPVSSLARRSR